MGEALSALWPRIKAGVSERITRNWSYDWRNQATEPLASFTFDDFPRSAAKVGAQILAEFGVKATYFVAGERAGRRVEDLDHYTCEDLVELAEAGHEIGCHTFAHRRLPTMRKEEIADDLARNREFVQRVLGDYTMTSFAYPYGAASIATKTFLGGRFAHCRGIRVGVNGSLVDFAQLKAVCLEQPFDYGRISRLLDEAETKKGWVIFFTHDVCERPSKYGCTPSQLAHVIETVVRRGIEPLPLKEAAARVRLS